MINIFDKIKKHCVTVLFVCAMTNGLVFEYLENGHTIFDAFNHMITLWDETNGCSGLTIRLSRIEIIEFSAVNVNLCSALCVVGIITVK